MKLKHVMLDLETMGTNPYSVIISIGAVHFDPDGDAIRDSFEVAVDPVSSVAAGLRLDTDTVFWWMDEARDAPRKRWMSLLKFELPIALYGFRDWLDHISEDKEKHSDVRIWGNGANFDNMLLSCAYKAAKIDVPWVFVQDRCFRTIKGLDPKGTLKPDHNFLAPGTAHTALYDAIYQARWMQNICAKHKLVAS